MKYYVIVINNDKDKSVYDFESLDLALSTYHSKMATAMKSEDTLSMLVVVVNSVGAILKNDYYKRGV